VREDNNLNIFMQKKRKQATPADDSHTHDTHSSANYTHHTHSSATTSAQHEYKITTSTAAPPR
jgi:hypothetical protein